MPRKKTLASKAVARNRIKWLILIATVEFLLLAFFAVAAFFAIEYWKNFSKSHQELQEVNSRLATKIESLYAFIQNTYTESELSQTWRHSEGISFTLPQQWRTRVMADSSVAFYDQYSPLEVGKRSETQEGSCFVHFLDNPEQFVVQRFLAQNSENPEYGENRIEKIESINGFQGLSVDQPVTLVEGRGQYSYYVRKEKRIFQFSYFYPTVQQSTKKFDDVVASFYAGMCRTILDTLKIE